MARPPLRTPAQDQDGRQRRRVGQAQRLRLIILVLLSVAVLARIVVDLAAENQWW
ncbi:MAG: hypothetical protein PHS60_15325 [Zavarzinia sp.]|nr:hypothetical protein [Zavarzinia sp.]